MTWRLSLSFSLIEATLGAAVGFQEPFQSMPSVQLGTHFGYSSVPPGTLFGYCSAPLSWSAWRPCLSWSAQPQPVAAVV